MWLCKYDECDGVDWLVVTDSPKVATENNAPCCHHLKTIFYIDYCAKDFHFLCVVWQEMVKCWITVLKGRINAQDNAGWTPLHEAICHCHYKVAELLLQSGADANCSSTDGTRSVKQRSIPPSLSQLSLVYICLIL